MSTVHALPTARSVPPSPPGGLRGALRRALEELDVVVDRDPSVHGRAEALLHPSVLARAGHAAGAVLLRHGRRRAARAVCGLTRVATGGIEIHPGATIGRRFFVDHGCGVVIGETAVVGDDVTLFHQVTLGSVGWWQDARRGEGARRHPRLGDGVTIGANATILGAVDVGDRALVGAQALVLHDVPPGAHVRAVLSEVVPAHAPDPDPLPLGLDRYRNVVGFPP